MPNQSQENIHRNVRGQKRKNKFLLSTAIRLKYKVGSFNPPFLAPQAKFTVLAFKPAVNTKFA